MNAWTEPKQLVQLAQFYERAKKHPEISDSEFIENVNKAFWATNCWSFVEAAFAIIAPACSMRPHLTKELIKSPIDAMIAGGIENPSEIIIQGTAYATKENPYIEPSDEGKIWLLNEWPKLQLLVNEVFHEIWNELDFD